MADKRTDGMDISAFFGVLRRRLPIIVLVMVAAALGAYLVSKGQEAKYTATTELLLKGSPSTQPNIAAYAPSVPASAPDREALVTREEVLERTERSLARRIGKERAEAASANLTALSGQEQSVIELEATAPRADDAALAANALARANIAFRKAQTLRGVRRAQRIARGELAKLDPSNPRDAGAANTINQELSTLRGAASSADGGAEIVKRATPPASPSSPKPNRNAIIGAFGGLLLGLAIALTVEQLDRRVRHARGLEEAFGLPVLANVPKSRALAGTNGKALEQLPARDAEAFQLLRANLRHLNTDRELRSVVVTSTDVGDGKSTVALNLAKADAAVGRRVLLIEADLRRPRLGTLLGLDHADGLTTYLGDPAKPLADVTHRLPVGRGSNGKASANTLDVVIAGQIAGNPSELINSERMSDLIDEAEADYDLVVLDTPPATMVADAIPLMSQATAVIVVGRVGRITSAQADSLREQLERIDAPAFGLVANFASGGSKYGYGYYG